jgi:hypothetical protein
MELLVPIGIFVLGIIISIAGGSLGIERLVEAQKAAAENLGRTAAYLGPFDADSDSTKHPR